MKLDGLCLRHVHGQMKRMKVRNKAAKILRKDLLVTDEVFEGDVSEKRQSRSAPNSLVKLISMIFEGGNLHVSCNLVSRRSL